VELLAERAASTMHAVSENVLLVNEKTKGDATFTATTREEVAVHGNRNDNPLQIYIEIH